MDDYLKVFDIKYLEHVYQLSGIFMVLTRSPLVYKTVYSRTTRTKSQASTRMMSYFYKRYHEKVWHDASRSILDITDIKRGIAMLQLTDR